MNATLFQDKYPVLVAEMAKREATCKTVAEIADHLKGTIAADPYAQFIASVDHLAHTRRRQGEIHRSAAARNLPLSSEQR